MLLKCVLLLSIIAVITCAQNVVHLHGAWHGSWAYDRIKDKVCYNKLFIDYPSLLNTSGIIYPTLGQYVNLTINEINKKFGDKSKISIVAHSASGPLATLLVDTLGKRVKKIVLISAFIVPNGLSLLEVGGADTSSLLYQNILFNIDPNTGYPDGTYYVNSSAVESIFYNKCSNRDVNFATQRLNNREVFPVMEPVFYQTDNLHKVKKYYILNTHDNAISYSHQQLMVSTSPFGRFKVFLLSGDHSPFFSKALQLSTILNFIFLGD